MTSLGRPNLSIVIVNWNTREMLAACLGSVDRRQWMGIRGQRTGDTATWGNPQEAFGSAQDAGLSTACYPLIIEVLVVDNASSDESASMVRERFPWVRLIENTTNVGFARANNQAISQAQARYVLLLNPDTVVRPGALEALVCFMEAHPRAGACGARLLNADGSLQHACRPMLTPGRDLWRLLFLERVWPRATYPMHRWDAVVPRQVEVIKGAALLLRREALDQVGLLDEGYFMYTEEVDLCHRLAQAGWELWYVPTAVVTHFGEASSRQIKEDMYLQLYRSKVQFYRKFGGEARATRFKRLLRLAYWPRWTVAALSSRLTPSLSAQTRIYRRLLAELAEM